METIDRQQKTKELTEEGLMTGEIESIFWLKDYVTEGKPIKKVTFQGRGKLILTAIKEAFPGSHLVEGNQHSLELQWVIDGKILVANKNTSNDLWTFS